ncbi:MAG: putative F420-dependent oxidoreductase [Ilumatobacteraceae bacterium]|nr:putative F420-dependent oxidoreductase [Ilumatobacteraceae bacterium]
MTTSEIVEAARQAMGRVGAKIPSVGISTITPIDQQRVGVRKLEAAGYTAGWNGEGVGAKDAFVELSVLLAATDRMLLAPSIANMYARPAPTTHGAAAMLADAFPGRFLLGIGGGYDFQAAQARQELVKPLVRMRDYFSNMVEPQPVLDVPEVAYARLIGANGPKMLALAGEIADGAMPMLVPASYVADARKIIGPDKLLVVAVLVAPDEDRERARAVMSGFVSAIAGFPGSPVAANLAQLGYSPEELATGATRIVDDITAYGAPDEIASSLRTFLDAGADHVIVTSVVPDFDLAIAQLTALAPAIVGL